MKHFSEYPKQITGGGKGRGRGQVKIVRFIETKTPWLSLSYLKPSLIGKALEKSL